MKGLGNDAAYWKALGEGALSLPKCASCRQWRWPAPFRCGDCGSWSFEWQAVPMQGVIYSWTRTAHPFAGAEDFERPYVTVSVALPQAGGVRLFGLLEPGEDAAIGRLVVGRVRKTRAFGRELPALSWSVAE